jgi:hypothetical protein|tara:strand:+ start:131 stop:562 length:432 start_codon:yes stop_codon:yes gene_type:complete
MSKKTTIPDQEKLEHLIIDIKSTRHVKENEANMTKIDSWYQTGRLIYDHELYKEWKKGTGDLIKIIAKQTQISVSELYLRIQAAKEYKDVSAIVEKLPSKEKPTVTGIRRLLTGKNEIKCKHDYEKVDAWKCNKCSQIRRTKP